MSRVRRLGLLAAILTMAVVVATAPAAAATATVKSFNTTTDFDDGSFNQTVAQNDSVQLTEGSTSSYDVGPFSRGSTATAEYGLVFEVDLSGEATFTLADDADLDTGSVEIVNQNTENVVYSTTAGPGDTVTAELDPGTYRITHYSSDGVYQASYGNGPSLPVNVGDGLSVTNGYANYDGGSEDIDTDWYQFRTVGFTPIFASGSYTSPSVAIENIEEVAIGQTSSDGTFDFSLQYNDGAQWQTYETLTASSSGTVTSTVDDTTASTYQSWRLQADFSVDGAVTGLTIDSIDFRADTVAPSVSLLQPADGETFYEKPIHLEATVSDDDFDTVQGDSLTVDFVDGSGVTIDSQTISEAGNVSTTYNDPVAGENEWSVTVTDDYGNTVTSATRTFTTPEQLEIRDEQNPDTLITNPGSAEVRFYTDSDQVYTRSPDNGTISLAGLPADETFVAAVSVEGYETRTITIDSLLEQQTAYLLSENATVAEVDFELNDQTNQFPADQTTLFVQRAITRNNSTAWRTIVGERFGATGTVPTTLAAGDRYRLKVRNRDGDMRALGSYVAAGAAIEPLRIGQVTFQGAQDSGASFSSRFDSTSESEAVDLRYIDPSGDTDELNVTVRRQDANNTVVFEDSISGPITTYRERIPTSALPDHTDDSSYQVEYSAARSGAAVPISGNRTIGDVPSVATDWPVDPQFLNIAGYLTVLALFGAMVILSPRHAGLVGSATAFALSIMGVIAINALVLSFALVVSGLFAVGGES